MKIRSFHRANELDARRVQTRTSGSHSTIAQSRADREQSATGTAHFVLQLKQFSLWANVKFDHQRLRTAVAHSIDTNSGILRARDRSVRTLH